MKYDRGPFLRYLRIWVYFGFQAGANCGSLDNEANVLTTWPQGQEKSCQKKFMYFLILIDRQYFFCEKALAILNIHTHARVPSTNPSAAIVKNGSLKYLILGCFGVLRGPKVTPHQAISWSSTFNFIALKKRGD